MSIAARLRPQPGVTSQVNVTFRGEELFLALFALAKYFGIKIWKIEIDLRTEHRGKFENSFLISASGSYAKCSVKSTHGK